MSWFKKELHVHPYSELAYIYDDVMSHVDYYTWAKFVNDIVKRIPGDHINVLDVACGTGNLLMELEAYDYQLWGIDNSYTMLKKFKEKLDRNSAKIPVWQSNMIAFHSKMKFDVILCLYDSFNYIQYKDDWHKFFNSVSDCLVDNGLLIFDICTEKNSIKYFNNYFEKNRGKDYNYTRKSTYDKKERIHSNIFKINFDNSNVIFVEQHQQKIYSIQEIVDYLADTKFKILDILDDFSFKIATEKSLRAHFILKKVS